MRSANGHVPDQRPASEHPPPDHLRSRGPVVLLGLGIGILLMGLQLWLLTVAFDLYRAGKNSETVVASIISGCVFLGGVVMLLVLTRGPSRRG